jgi:hypothetical protein
LPWIRQYVTITTGLSHLAHRISSLVPTPSGLLLGHEKGPYWVCVSTRYALAAGGARSNRASLLLQSASQGNAAEARLSSGFAVARVLRSVLQRRIEPERDRIARVRFLGEAQMTDDAPVAARRAARPGLPRIHPRTRSAATI